MDFRVTRKVARRRVALSRIGERWLGQGSETELNQIRDLWAGMGRAATPWEGWMVPGEDSKNTPNVMTNLNFLNVKNGVTQPVTHGTK